MKKKKNTGWTEAALREETKADVVTQEDKREDLENLEKLRTPQSPLDPAHATYQGAAGRRQHSA